MVDTREPVFFPSPDAFRAWLRDHHAEAREVWVGYIKVGTGRPSMTWPQSVDQALCFGWIDGVRKRIDDDSYMIRFTPRATRSIWSAVNIDRMGELIGQGLVQPAGLAAFGARREDRSRVYAYEQQDAAVLGEADEVLFRSNERAWTFFQDQAPWYRRTAIRWVTSAKREETRQRRLSALIADSGQGRTIPSLTRPARTTDQS
ncbi:MAG: YdeI/OmpD-associated family protein [Chloroflexia bacterium]|nr:YdeI/OmpD-associated family protein [Chloroflexia bacterium]